MPSRSFLRFSTFPRGTLRRDSLLVGRHHAPSPWSPDDGEPDAIEASLGDLRFRFVLGPQGKTGTPPDPDWQRRQQATWTAWRAARHALDEGRLRDAIAVLEAALTIPPTTHHLHQLLLRCYRIKLRAAVKARQHQRTLSLVATMRRHDQQLATDRGERFRQILVSDLTAQLGAARALGDVATELEAEAGVLAWHPTSGAGRRIRARRLAEEAG